MMSLKKPKTKSSTTKTQSPSSTNRKTPAETSIFNLLKMKPVRLHKWRPNREDPDLITIHMPRFNSNFGRKLGNIFKIRPTYNINLEKYGSAVWRLCNGDVNVEEIGEVLREQYGDEVEPLYERLAQYLTFLERTKLIKYEKYVIIRRGHKARTDFFKK